MSLSNYEIYIIDPDGARLAGPLINPVSLEWTLLLNGVGKTSLQINAADWDDGWFNDRLLLQIWRQPRFRAAPQLLQWFWMLDYGKYDNGDVTIAYVRGYDLNEILNWRIVDGDAGSEEAEKSGDACAIMWDYVDEALLTDAGRDISGNFDFSGDVLVGGASIDYGASRGKVLSVLNGCANASSAAGTPVRFWVRPTESGGILRIAERPWGSDRRDHRPFSPEFGTLFNPRWEFASGQAETYAYVGGQGLEDDRTVVEVDQSDGTALGRRETWMENNQISNEDPLTDWGEGQLHERRARLTARGELRDTELSAFGRDWALGDWVTCEYDGRVFAAEVTAIAGRATEEGELIRAKVEGEVD